MYVQRLKNLKMNVMLMPKKTNEAYEANSILHRQIEMLNTEARDYIGRLETELNQTRQRLHQFTRISVPRRPTSVQQAAADESSEEEDDN